MSRNMLYYLAWEEDDWLDELLDYFPVINAVVPTTKTLQLMKEHCEIGEVDKAVIVINLAHEKEKNKDFLAQLAGDEELSRYPLYFVGLKEAEKDEWQAAYPQAKIIVITGFVVEFDFEAVCKQIEAEWGE
ncbi:hypothetical protein [Brevibacillus dissolubilis]|uniref:hypothetical protein n=1 Tax=Brevibacillus dissolubilis TaxID=1844116 RepID=UPI00111691D7|nr:hypothetical protein [Brevibacillus dissolubilis]